MNTKIITTLKNLILESFGLMDEYNSMEASKDHFRMGNICHVLSLEFKNFFLSKENSESERALKLIYTKITPITMQRVQV